jgi:hypothetical protein
MKTADTVISVGSENPTAVDFAHAADFHEFIRRASPEEIRETQEALGSQLAKFDASGIRNHLVEIIKERLQVVRVSLKLSV